MHPHYSQAKNHTTSTANTWSIFSLQYQSTPCQKIYSHHRHFPSRCDRYN